MRRPNPRKSVSLWSARLALALALVTLQLGGLAHLALVEHALCLEHGEWLESGSHSGHRASAIAERAASAEVRALSCPDAAPGDHCAVFARLRTLLEARTPTALTLPLEISVKDAPVIAIVRDNAAPLYFVAPKQSPPAVLA